MKSLKDYGYSGMDNGTKVRHFLQGTKSPELEAVVNVVLAQPEKYGTDFDTTMSYLGQMDMKKSLVMQSVCITKTVSQWVWAKVKAVWNFMTTRHQACHKADLHRC